VTISHARIFGRKVQPRLPCSGGQPQSVRTAIEARIEPLDQEVRPFLLPSCPRLQLHPPHDSIPNSSSLVGSIGPWPQCPTVCLGPCVDGSRLARRIFTCSVGQPCVRPVCAVPMTAGHNALRGSDPGQKHAFDDPVAHVGCPDRRIDRHCIKCCSSSQPLRHAGASGVISSTP
jgi:hypothetical protein